MKNYNLKLKRMRKLFYVIPIVLFFSVYLDSSHALTKPSPDTDPNSLSYVFFLYYDNGQLFGDRDFEVKFDVLSEAYSSPSALADPKYKIEIFTYKSEIAKTIEFDPRRGDSSFQGKIQVKAPYVSDATRAVFYDNKGNQLITMFLTAASLCNDDGVCSAVDGENPKNCRKDCRPTPIALPIPPDIEDEGFDYSTILIYVIGSLGVVFIGWIAWKWRKKKQEGSFLPPAPPPLSPEPPPSPFPPAQP